MKINLNLQIDDILTFLNQKTFCTVSFVVVSFCLLYSIYKKQAFLLKPILFL